MKKHIVSHENTLPSIALRESGFNLLGTTKRRVRMGYLVKSNIYEKEGKYFVVEKAGDTTVTLTQKRLSQKQLNDII